MKITSHRQCYGDDLKKKKKTRSLSVQEKTINRSEIFIFN